MATNNTAPVIPLRQPRRPMTGAERQRLCRARKKAAKLAEVAPSLSATQNVSGGLPPVRPQTARATTVTPSRHVTGGSQTARGVHFTDHTLRLAAFALGAVGMTMNGWFARSLGSTELAGWLFLAVGVTADSVALAVPSCAARLWQAHQRVAASVGWAIWMMTFVFALTAGIGFASLNISDVTMSRASRVTPIVMMAQTALDDAVIARDRECKTGVGKVCREREDTVNARRDALANAIGSVAQQADPQAAAAIGLVSWATLGTLKPSDKDFAMLRLALLSLLPQIGGLLLMLGRR